MPGRAEAKEAEMTATTSNPNSPAALPDYAPVPPSAQGPALNEVRGGGDLHIAVILGSTRPGRLGEQVARWVIKQARHRTDAEFDLVDLVDYPLPHLDEPLPPNMGAYQNAHTQEWAAVIGRYDGFVFVTPEYNHSTSGVLKNAIDYVYAEWNNKAMGVVSYGAAGGARAAEHLRLIAGELQMADVRTNVALSLFTDFKDFSELAPGAYQAQALETMLGQVIAWSQALAPLRQAAQAA
jgi:NAD(P)H-dependent FMN reductase